MSSFDQGYWCTPEHVIMAAVGLSVLDIVFVVLRFVARMKQHQPIRIDDWILIPATLFGLGISISMLYGISKKAIAYPYEIPPEAQGNALLVATDQISLAGQIQWTFFLLLPLALGCAKLSFLCFYKRVFAINKLSKTNILLVGMIVLISIWMAGFFLTSLFQCKLDFWALWDSPIAVVQHCISQPKIALALTITDFSTDIIIMAIPIPLIWKLNLKPAKKFAITGVFLLGAITVAVSLLRLILTERLLRFGFDPNTDAILLITSIQYWGLVESGVAVFVACLPTLWVLTKGWSWQPVTSAAKSIATFSNSSLRRLRTKSSKRSLPTTTNSVDRDYIRLGVYQADATTGSEKRVGGYDENRGDTEDMMLRPTGERDLALQSIKISGKPSSNSSSERLAHSAAPLPQTGIVSTTRFMLQEDRHNHQVD